MAGKENDLLAKLPMTRIAAELGVDGDTATATLRLTLPALLTGMKANAADPRGAESLGKAVAQHRGDVLGGSVDLNLLNPVEGAKIVANVFGHNTEAVILRLAGAPPVAAVGTAVTRKALTIMAPIVLTYLNQAYVESQRGSGKGAPPPQPSATAIQDLLERLVPTATAAAEVTAAATTAATAAAKRTTASSLAAATGAVRSATPRPQVVAGEVRDETSAVARDAAAEAVEAQRQAHDRARRDAAAKVTPALDPEARRAAEKAQARALAREAGSTELRHGDDRGVDRAASVRSDAAALAGSAAGAATQAAVGAVDLVQGLLGGLLGQGRRS